MKNSSLVSPHVDECGGRSECGEERNAFGLKGQSGGTKNTFGNSGNQVWGSRF